MKLNHYTIYIVLLLIVLLPAGSVQAKVIAGTAIDIDVTRDGLQTKMEQLEAKQGIDKESKTREMSWYQLADENLADMQWFEFHSSMYQKVLQTAPEILKNNKIVKKAKVYSVNNQLTEKQSELLIVTLKGELRTIIDQLSKLETEFSIYLNRPQQIRGEILNAKVELEQAKADISIARLGAENKYEYEAHQVYLHTLINAILAKFKKLELEATSNPIQIQLNRRSQEALVKQRNELDSVISEQGKLLEELQLKIAKEIQDQLLKAEKESISKHPVIQKIIQSNIQWSRDLQAIVHSINEYEHKIKAIENYKNEVESDYKNAEKKIKLAGLSPILGRVLREQRRNLESKKQLYQRSADIQDETGQISLALYRIEQKQKQLHNIQRVLEQYLKQMLLSAKEKQLSDNEVELIKQELLTLLDTQKQVLDKLSSIYLKDLRVLGDYEFSKQQLLTQIELYAAYLDERLLWVPSSPMIDLKYPLDVYNSTEWIISPVHWQKLIADLADKAREKLLVSFFMLLALVLLFYIKPYIRQKICIIKEKVGKPYTDKNYYTFQVLWFNFILVLPIPLLLIFMSSLLTALPFQDNFSRAVGEGLYYASSTLLILHFLIRFLETQGVAELHFRWKKKTITLLRQQLLWMRFFIIPCVFILRMTSALSATEHSDTLGRLGLNIFIFVLFVFGIRLFQPGKGILSDYFINNKKLWWVKLRYLWFIVFISIPIIILGFSAMGYFISAQELQQKIIITMRMIFIAIIVHNIVIRWLGLTNRELALKNARKVQEKNVLPAGAQNSDLIATFDEELLDIPKINEQTKKIVNVLISTLLLISFWVIWKNILPAFSFIDNIVLWHHIVITNGVESSQAVTLTNVFLAGLYIFLICIAAINFPGMMEMLVFRNLEIESGSRYAVNQLTKYLLITIGFISVASELGGSWMQVQWLVAALTVGLGFGLQEIFANMVSGIILLFERPIRVGDTVTVNNITGRVTRIQMRATTIIDWDHKELIVPNKTFITNQLVNWTLTDPVTRIVIPLGISYDADVAHAHRVILKAICSSPLVLKEPEPSVFFLGFGDSSLDFSIRVYVNELSTRLSVTHDINARLLSALRKEGIEIPFPQRDLHVDSMQPNLSVQVK